LAKVYFANRSSTINNMKLLLLLSTLSILETSGQTVKVNTTIILSATGADNYWWRFGDGLIDQGQRTGRSVTYTYRQPGVYVVTCIGWRGLEPSFTYTPVTVLPDSGTWVSVSVKDSYIAALKGRFVKTIYANGTPVWSDDVAGYEGWQRVTFRCDTIRTIAIELRSPSGCKQPEIQELFCWWDAVSVVSPSGVLFHDSFEGKVNWSISTSPIGTGVSTQTPVGERRDGERSYLFRYAVGKDAGAGWRVRLTKTIQ
jgi:hypothetical protein